MGPEVWTDPVLSWIGAAGVVVYLVHVHRQRSRSAVEGKMLFLLYCLFALFFVRGFYWLTNDVRLQVPAFVPATLLPLAIALFVEALLRRHLSPALKAFVALGTVLLFLLNVLNPIGRADLFTGYKVFSLSTILWLGLVLITRDRRRLSLMENRFIDGFTAALGFTFVLATTDMQMRPEWLHFRIGSLGGLIFVYVCLRLINLRESRVAVPAEILGLVGKASVGTVAYAVTVGDVRIDTCLSVFFVSCAFVLLLAILERLREIRVHNGHSSFVRWLIAARTDSIEGFVASLNGLPMAREHVVVRGADLAGYDPDLIVGAFEDSHPVLTLSSLRSELAGHGRSPDLIEQVVALLETYEMTHATLLSSSPPVLLLLNLPEFAGGHNPLLQLGLLQKFGRLLKPA